MAEKTRDYDKFIFRDDNRSQIDQAHVKKLINSIKSKNLLDLRPIDVNSDFEIIDGQHRLLAAKELGLEIYYNVKNDLKSEDIIRMNIAKPWTNKDYLNFYVKHDNEEYKKFQQFMLKNKIDFKIAYSILCGSGQQTTSIFREGKYIFDSTYLSTDIEYCWQTIDIIKKNNGVYPQFYIASKFWKALISLIRHPDFDINQWVKNCLKLTSNLCIKATQKEYLKCFLHIYNYNLKSEHIKF